MRVIQGAPWWTRLVNLRLETKLVPLQTRIQQSDAGHVCKLVSRHNPPLLRDRFIELLTEPRGPLPGSLPWHSAVFGCIIDTLNLLPSLRSRNIDRPHHGYREPHPWESKLFTVIANLSTSKARYIHNDSTILNHHRPSTQMYQLNNKQAELELHSRVRDSFVAKDSVMTPPSFRQNFLP